MQIDAFVLVFEKGIACVDGSILIKKVLKTTCSQKMINGFDLSEEREVRCSFDNRQFLLRLARKEATFHHEGRFAMF